VNSLINQEIEGGGAEKEMRISLFSILLFHQKDMRISEE
jgi:hypothetical protein